MLFGVRLTLKLSCLLLRLYLAMVMLYSVRLTPATAFRESLPSNTSLMTLCSNSCLSSTRSYLTSLKSMVKLPTHGPMWMHTVVFYCRSVYHQISPPRSLPWSLRCTLAMYYSTTVWRRWTTTPCCSESLVHWDASHHWFGTGLWACHSRDLNPWALKAWRSLSAPTKTGGISNIFMDLNQFLVL